MVDGLSKLNISQQTTILNYSCDISVYNPDQLYNNDNVLDISEENTSSVEEIPSIELTTVKTKFGKPKLCYDGYFYTIDRKSGIEPNVKIEWKCEQCNSNSIGKCNGRVKTSGAAILKKIDLNPK